MIRASSRGPSTCVPLSFSICGRKMTEAPKGEEVMANISETQLIRLFREWVQHQILHGWTRGSGESTRTNP